MTDDNGEKVLRDLDALRSSQDSEALERAAVALASSEDATSLMQLGEFLRRWDFLSRLDDLNGSDIKTLHLREVMAALEAHPSPAVADLCLTLSRDEAFMSDDDRMDFLLETLSAVRPMTEEVVDLFRQTNAEGYFAFNAPLLAKNSSPLALDLFESMTTDRTVDVNRRVDTLHRSLLPYRTSLPILNIADRLLAADLEEPVAIGLIETVFDYQSKRWFGPAIGAPKPPSWETASDEALQVVVRLADIARARGGIPASLLVAVDDTLTIVQNILERRKL